MPISISKLPEVTNVKDNSFMLITQDGTTKRTMCDQFVTEEEARLDEFSPTVITSKSMSKTGEGDNVDYSSSVYDAPMKDVILKGKTMVNCIQEPSSQDVVLPYEFEDGQYVTINDTKESCALGVELKGNTLVNLLGEIAVDLNHIAWSEDENNYNLNLAAGNGQPTLSFRTLYTLPANKTYTLFINMTSYTTGIIHIDFRTPTNTSNSSNQNYFGEAGWKKLVFTTTEETGFVRMFNRNGVDNTFSISKSLILLEGDHTNTPIPNYFTGMASCKMPILKNVGKNLCNIEEYNNFEIYSQTVTKDGDSLILETLNENAWRYVTVSKVFLEAGKQYTISCNCEVLNATEQNLRGILVLWSIDHVNNISGDATNSNNFTRTFTATESQEAYVKIYSSNGTGGIGNKIKYSNIQVEESPSKTPYEAYKTSILSLPEEVVLRGIGDVKDTLNLTTGEYVQRIGSITASELEASDYFKADLELENTVQFGMLTRGREKLRAKTSAKSVCNIIPVMLGNDDVFHARVDGGTPYGSFTIWMDKTKLETEDVFGLIKWLRDNNAVIQYELATPIVTKINLSSTLKSWNTTTHIYSEIPENTLYPILSHSNPSYPVILKPSTKYSIVANSYSNNHTNSTINFNLGGATTSTTVGNRVTTITTPSTLTSEELVMSGRGNKLNNVMVIEGDIVGDEPYFEGICDCKSPILSNCGKNLFDGKIELGGIGSNGIPYDSDVLQRSMNFTRVSPNTTYKISDTSAIDGFNIIEYDFNKNIIERNWMGNKPFTTKTNCHYVKWFNSKVDEERFVIIEQGSYPSPYEPYKSNTTTFEQKDDKTIVLRSLPKGVCDTLNIETGEYVQRIGEVVLCGNNGENWSVDTRKNNRIGFVTRATYGQKVASGDKAIISDNLVTVSDSDVKYSMDYTIAIGNIANYPIVITVPFDAIDESSNTEKDNTVSINNFKIWLSQNPVTVQYELATPIVTTVDVQGFPYAYTNGHVQLSSGRSGQSLTPKVEYNIATNRDGQITQNTKSLIRQGKLLDDIEDKINQIIEATINNSIMLMKLRNK